ncbi:MAG: Gfo/Idh/MocA family oxidoreductase [Chloroflexi bacterium]|jgi:predicted dehydrogenase|nr:Gfo/Idh/MocA family oxidoreductase [Chloroflexota bacterium]
MKTLIAGFGSIGRRHFRNLYALGERDFVFLRSQRSTLPDDEIADYPVEVSIEAALTHKPNAVVIANPTSLHLGVAIPAAELGCYIFMEKPVSHSLERVDELEAAVKRGGGQVLVGFQYRYHPLLRKAKILLAEGAIGGPVAARVHWGEYLPGWHPWEDYRKGFSARADLGGGVILTLTHPLDYLRWLFGDVVGIWAFTQPVKALEIDEVESVAEMGLRFVDGVLGSVHLSYIQRPHTHQLEIIGTEGTIYWDYVQSTLKIYQAEADAWTDFPIPENYERNVMFLDQMEHFIRVVRGTEKPICTLEDGIWAQRLANGALESAALGQIISWGNHKPSQG